MLLGKHSGNFPCQIGPGCTVSTGTFCTLMSKGQTGACKTMAGLGAVRRAMQQQKTPKESSREEELYCPMKGNNVQHHPPPTPGQATSAGCCRRRWDHGSTLASILSLPCGDEIELVLAMQCHRSPD